MERRGQAQERRQREGLQLPAERRTKTRRRLRKFYGSPPAEDIIIDVADQDVVRFWAVELEISTDELTSIVQKVGPSVKAVRAHLGK